MKTHQISFQVSAETNASEFLFSFRAYIKDHIRIGSDSISIPELQERTHSWLRLQNLIFEFLRFRQHKYAVSADIKGIFLQVEVREEDFSFSSLFVAGGPHIKCGCSPIHLSTLWCS